MIAAAPTDKMAANTIGPTTRIQPEVRSEVLPLRCQHRSEDSTQRAQPDDGGDCPRALVGLGEVSRHEPALQRSRLCASEQDHADEQQPHPSHLAAECGDGGAARPDERTRRPTPAADPSFC